MDIAVHLNNLNRMLEGRHKVVSMCYNNIQVFKCILALWEMTQSNNNPALFPCLRDLCNAGSAEDLVHYKDKISSVFNNLSGAFKYLMNWRQISESFVVNSL